MGARHKRKDKTMYKIMWLNSDVEPVAGFRSSSRADAQKLVDAWNANFDKKIRVVSINEKE